MSIDQSQECFEDKLMNVIKKMKRDDMNNFIKNNHLQTLMINSKNDTLLHIAAKSGEVEIVKLLIDNGSNVNAQNNLGKTPISLAIESKPNGFFKVIEMLYIANADVSIVDKNGKSAAHFALDNLDCTFDHVHKFFLEIIYHESKNDSQITANKLLNLHYPLWQAVLLEKAKVIEQMITLGYPVNSSHPKKKFTALIKAVQLNNLELVKVLIKHGADVDMADSWGFLPIAHCYNNISDNIERIEIIKILLNKSVLLKNLHQGTIYQLKKVFECGSKEVIQLLLEYDKDILNIRDGQNQTPLHYLAGNHHSDITEVLKDQKIDVNVSDNAGCTPLFIATYTSFAHINTFKFLLEKGANVNSKTNFEDLDVPLFALCNNHSLTQEEYFEVIEMFLEYDLDIQFVGLKHKTVFDIITEHETFYMAKPLIVQLAILDELEKPIIECIRNKIDSHKIFKEYLDICKGELANMKNDVIHENITLYAILVNEVSEKMVLNRCRFNSDSLLSFKRLKTNFSTNNYYYHVVQKRISSIISKLEFLQKAAPIISKLLKLGFNPCHIVVTEIIGYLDDQDLKNLINVEI